jgi:hypothetical protein
MMQKLTSLETAQLSQDASKRFPLSKPMLIAEWDLTEIIIPCIYMYIGTTLTWVILRMKEMSGSTG